MSPQNKLIAVPTIVLTAVATPKINLLYPPSHSHALCSVPGLPLSLPRTLVSVSLAEEAWASVLLSR